MNIIYVIQKNILVLTNVKLFVFQAYKLKTRPTAVQIARIAAFTVIACTFIMGSFMLGAAWLQANASCSQLMHAEALLRQVYMLIQIHIFIYENIKIQYVLEFIIPVKIKKGKKCFFPQSLQKYGKF